MRYVTRIKRKLLLKLVDGRPLIERGHDTSPRLALLFDDGPNPVHTPRLIELLSSHGIRATFFLIGAAIVTFFGTAITDFLRIFDQTSPQPPTQETIWKLIAIVYAGVAVLIAAWLIQSLVWACYSAREMNVFAAYTTIDQARFKFDATAPSLMWLWIGNLLLIICTLGIAVPFAQQRLVRYLCDQEVSYYELPRCQRRWARVRNISTDGVGLVLSAPIDPGTDLVIEMKTMDPDASLILPARVVHATMQEEGS